MARSPKRRATLIAAIVCLQAVAAVFFIVDAVRDFRESGADLHLVIEFVIAVALVVGVILNGLELRELLTDARRAQATIQAASGAMGELMQLRFREWSLTAAEADVALLALKGLAIEDIARLRQAAAGTVRAQLTRVYAKAGVNSRTALLSLFVDDLLAEPLHLAD